jgi:aminocarboxymuconate-semialdehyde decarboxylase
MYTRRWLDLVRTSGGKRRLKMRPDGREEIFAGRNQQPGHFDYDMRLKTMDTSGIDISIVCSRLATCTGAAER